MKGAVAIAAASAALASAVATPSKVEANANQARAASLPTVTVKGNAFFAGNERFYIRGVDYQPGGSSEAEDPIADTDNCKRDVAEFKKLGVNTVRIYTVDNSKNHDACMSALADAGIYLALDVNSPKYSINQADPAPSYNDVYLQSVFATIDVFSQYDNTLLFFSGNEVINEANTTNAAPYVKATTRDMRNYIKAQGYRPIPVGYSAADVEDTRFDMANYMNCGDDEMRSDFFAFNDYSWCDPSSFSTSGWDQKVKQYSSYSIPLFLSEFGCITNKRTFEEIKTLYSSQMTSVYSGGLVYEYSEEGSGYGLVNIQGNSVSETPDFTALQKQYDQSKPSGDGGYKSSGSPSKCPPASKNWRVSDFPGADLPSIPGKAEQYMQKGAGKPPGLKGDGSQYAGTASSGTATAGSGSGTGSGSSSSSSGAAVALARGDMALAPIMACGAVVLFSTLFGASML